MAVLSDGSISHQVAQNKRTTSCVRMAVKVGTAYICTSRVTFGEGGGMMSGFEMNSMSLTSC